MARVEGLGHVKQTFGAAYRGKRVLVTGHTGFKGAWLSSWLTELGAEVCGYSKDIPTSPSLFNLASLSNRMEHRVGDIRDFDSLSAAFRTFRPDYVFHMAAQPIVSVSYSDPIETVTSNVFGTVNVLEALRSIEWPCVAIIVTSDKCYENVEWVWGYRETDRLGGKDVYSASKAAAEIMFHSFWYSFFKPGSTPVRLATARAGNVIGGGDWAADRIVADCVRAWTAGRRVPIRSPAATRPWQHVLEPLSGYLALGAHLFSSADYDGESYNFGPRAEQNHTVVEMLDDLSKAWGFETPDDAYEIVDDIPFHEAGLLKLSCDKSLLKLKWEPTLAYHECIGLTGSWYRQVLQEGRPALELTLEHIRQYEYLGRIRGRSWAPDEHST